MRTPRLILIGTLAAALAAPAATAGIPLQQQVNRLKSRVDVLQARVGVLNQQVNGLIAMETDTRNGLVYESQARVCGDAMIFDILRIVTQILTGGDPGTLDDKGACAAIGVTRTPQARALATNGGLERRQLGLMDLFGRYLLPVQLSHQLR